MPTLPLPESAGAVLLAVVCLLSVAVLPAVTAPTVAAQSGNTTAGQVLDDVSNITDDNASFGLATAQAAVSGARGMVARAKDLVVGLSSETSASKACSDLRTEFNANNASIESYVNSRTNASTEADVLKLTCDIDGETATVYLQADVNGSDYQNASMVNSTGRTADETCTLEDAAARNAAEELGHVVTEYVSPDTDIPASYRRKVTARYAGKVSCSWM